MTLALIGHIDNRDETIRLLQTENEELRRQLRDAQSEAATARSHGSRAISKLRTQLTPLHQAINMVFDEMDAIDGGNVQQESSSKWDFWKKRYPGRIAETIDLLLVQKAMNSKQLCHALRCDPRTLAKSVIYHLNSAGLINKNGGQFSLKEL